MHVHVHGAALHHPPPATVQERHAAGDDSAEQRKQQALNIVSKWRQKEKLKTTAVALVLCLNIGVDPPDVIKISPCARLECWVDPMSMQPAKALETIGELPVFCCLMPWSVTACHHIPGTWHVSVVTLELRQVVSTGGSESSQRLSSGHRHRCRYQLRSRLNVQGQIVQLVGADAVGACLPHYLVLTLLTPACCVN